MSSVFCLSHICHLRLGWWGNEVEVDYLLRSGVWEVNISCLCGKLHEYHRSSRTEVEADSCCCDTQERYADNGVITEGTDLWGGDSVGYMKEHKSRRIFILSPPLPVAHKSLHFHRCGQNGPRATELRCLRPPRLMRTTVCSSPLRHRRRPSQIPQGQLPTCP